MPINGKQITSNNYNKCNKPENNNNKDTSVGWSEGSEGSSRIKKLIDGLLRPTH